MMCALEGTCADRRPRSHAAPGRRARALIGVLALLTGVACAGKGPAPAPSLPGKPVETYRVRPPDQLTITVLPEPVIERTATVRPDGMISVDLLGDVPVAGRTTEEIASDIQNRISRYKRDASVTVALALSRSTEITILGEVNRPGVFPLEKDTRIIEAIGRVGGATHFAALEKIRVIRSVDNSANVYRIDLDAILQGDLSTNIFLQGGDIIIVPPTRMARTGYGLRGLLFPFQQLLGLGTSVTTQVVTP